MKIVKQELMVRKDTLLFLVVVELGMFLLGSVIHDIFVRTEIVDSATTFPMATLLSLIGAIIFLFFYCLSELPSLFNHAIGMSMTRKQFIPRYLIGNFVIFAIAYLELVALNYLDELRLVKMFPDYPLEASFRETFTVKPFLLVVFVGSAVAMLFGMLVLRLGKTGFWIAWGAWMVCCVLGPKVIHVFSDGESAIATTVMDWFLMLTPTMLTIIALVVSGVLIAISWGVMLHQQVQN